MSDLLTDDELERLTRAKTKSKQRAILRKNGIRFIDAADGAISVTWTAINHALTNGHQKNEDDKANWRALDAA